MSRNARSPDDDLFLAADDRFFQRELLLDAKIAAAARALPPSPLRARRHPQKTRRKGPGTGRNVARPGAREIEAAALESGMAELVVAGAFLAVREDAESLGGLFEFDRGSGIVWLRSGWYLRAHCR